MDYNFRVGDYVKRPYGNTIYCVASPASHPNMYYSRFTIRCLRTNKVTSHYTRNFILVENYSEDEIMTNQKTLYSFVDENGTTQYGVHVGTDSSNRYLIEVKGTNNIVVKDKKELEEVLPYTFSTIINGKETHFQITPGTVEKGDVLLYTGLTPPVVVSVKAVDTKSKEARSKFNGAKLVTEKL